MKYVLLIVWMLGLLAGGVLTGVGAHEYGAHAVTGAAVGFFILWACLGLCMCLMISDGDL